MGKDAPTDQPSMSTVIAALLPLLPALPAADLKEKPERKPCYLVTKGLPTLSLKKVWALELVDMEDFLPAPQALRLVEQ